jgi:FemAB-related protein (PEP-CTERM system-associated)
VSTLSVPITAPLPALALANASVRVHTGDAMTARLPALAEFVSVKHPESISRSPSWLLALAGGLGHAMYCLELIDGTRTRGILPLAYMRSAMFGRFLVGLPYLNVGGVIAEDGAACKTLVDRAIELADVLDVRFLELRHERAVTHAQLVKSRDGKVNMRLALPSTPTALWDQLPAKVRNQVRKARRNDLSVTWGAQELLADFYDVFSRNMRDLGTPAYGICLFASILHHFRGQAELCVVRAAGRPISGALLLHGDGMTEVPSASSLRSQNHTCANMLMYWHLLERAIGRGQSTFDFGRSSPGSGTYRFKLQWGARPVPTHWQYYLRRGDSSDMRPSNPKYRRLIRIWQHLPVCLTRILGPWCVRGIP